jgi:hypothetical protein
LTISPNPTPPQGKNLFSAAVHAANPNAKDGE